MRCGVRQNRIVPGGIRIANLRVTGVVAATMPLLPNVESRPRVESSCARPHAIVVTHFDRITYESMFYR